jgi:hypothetical protein
LKEKGIQFVFMNVHEDDAPADELRSLYSSGKLNFPTILVGTCLWQKLLVAENDFKPLRTAFGQPDQ